MGATTIRTKRQADEWAALSSGHEAVTISRFRVITHDVSYLLSVTEFAGEARITPQAVRKMIAGHRLHAEKVGEQHVIPRHELNRYLSER